MIGNSMRPNAHGLALKDVNVKIRPLNTRNAIKKKKKKPNMTNKTALLAAKTSQP